MAENLAYLRANTNAISQRTSPIHKSTSRTIIADITGIRQYFQQSILIENTSSGYLFKETNREAYQTKKAVIA